MIKMRGGLSSVFRICTASCPSALSAVWGQAAGGEADCPETLFEELVDLVESPKVLRGRIADRFLQLPPEVISTAERGLLRAGRGSLGRATLGWTWRTGKPRRPKARDHSKVQQLYERQCADPSIG